MDTYPDARPPRQLPPRNPQTQLKHQHEVLWQITIPLVMALIVVLGVVVLTCAASSAQASKWADISLIWLIVPAFMAVLVFTILTLAMVYALVRLIQVLPGYARLIHNYVLLIGEYVRVYGDKAVEPVLQVEALLAGLRTVRGKFKRQ